MIKCYITQRKFWILKIPHFVGAFRTKIAFHHVVQIQPIAWHHIYNVVVNKKNIYIQVNKLWFYFFLEMIYYTFVAIRKIFIILSRICTLEIFTQWHSFLSNQKVALLTICFNTSVLEKMTTGLDTCSCRLWYLQE